MSSTTPASSTGGAAGSTDASPPPRELRPPEGALTSAGKEVAAGGGRDVRIDFIRGWVMLILVIVHTEIFSLWNLLVWERVGMISGGEGFVLLSGLVLGMVSRQRMARSGFADAASRVLDRALQIYRVHVTLIFFVGMLAIIFGSHVAEITSFTDRGSGKVYPLYPAKVEIFRWLGSIVTLKLGPHQVQVLGLYVCLIMICPLLLVALWKKRPLALLGLSWVIYFSNLLDTKMPTGAQFEYAFPVLTWQVLFVHGLVAGYHLQEIKDWFATRRGRAVFVLCVVITLFFLAVSQLAPNTLVPSWAKIDAWPSFYWSIRKYADKNSLGPLRLLNYAAFLIVLYAVLTRWWPLIQRTLGWFFVPIGQASLYVFIMHLVAVQVSSMIIPFGFVTGTPMWATTLLHTGELAFLWLLVRHKVLFRWIPR